jgi:hypothetical protein
MQANVIRFVDGPPPFDTIIGKHHKAHLYFGDSRVDLSGPKHGFIASGILVDASNTYEGNKKFDIRLIVLRRLGISPRFQREIWQVKLLDPAVL